MSLTFISKEHQESMEHAFNRAGIAGTVNRGIETPLYVLTSIYAFQNEKNLEKVFSFEGGYFNPDALQQFQLSTGENALFGLAINLYNGYVLDGVYLSPHQAMSWLSTEHREVYLTALNYRYR